MSHFPKGFAPSTLLTDIITAFGLEDVRWDKIIKPSDISELNKRVSVLHADDIVDVLVDGNLVARVSQCRNSDFSMELAGRDKPYRTDSASQAVEAVFDVIRANM
jgi:hypothetical protein